MTDKNVLMTHVAYIRDYWTTDVSGRGTCSNCSTAHRGACPVASLLRRLRWGADPAAHIEAHVQARLLEERERILDAVNIEAPAVVDRRADAVA